LVGHLGVLTVTQQQVNLPIPMTTYFINAQLWVSPPSSAEAGDRGRDTRVGKIARLPVTRLILLLLFGAYLVGEVQSVLAAPTPFSEDSYLSRTSLGPVQRSFDGQFFSYTKHSTFNQATYPAYMKHTLVNQAARSRLFVHSRLTNAESEVKVPGSVSAWPGRWSPRSDRLIVFSFEAESWRVHIGIWNARIKRYAAIAGFVDFPPGASGQDLAVWLGGDRVGYANFPASLRPSVLRGASTTTPTEVVENYSGMGDQAGVPIGSTLRSVNAEGRASNDGGARDIERLVASPSGAGLAALVLGRVESSDPDIRMTGSDQNHYQTTRSVHVVLYDADLQEKAAAPSNLDVFPASVVWSPDSKSVTYIAKRSGFTWEHDAGIWVTEVNGASHQLNTHGLDLYSWYSANGDITAGTVRGDLDWFGSHVITTARAWLPPVHAPEDTVVSRTVFRVLSDTDDPKPLSDVINLNANAACRLDQRWLILANEQLYIAAADTAPAVIVQNTPGKISKLITPIESKPSPLSCGAGPGNTIFIAFGADAAAKVAQMSLGTPSLGMIPDLPLETVSSMLSLDPTTSVIVVKSRGNQSLLLKRLDPLESIEVASAGLGDVKLGEEIHFKFVPTEGAHRTPLNAWLVLPPGSKPNAKLPLVVIVYGGDIYGEDKAPSSWADPTSHLYINAHLIASRGYAVLMPSTPMTASFGGALADELSATTASAIDKAAEFGYVDSNRVGLIGHSYGGYSVLMLASKIKGLRAVVAHSAVTDLIAEYTAFDRSLSETEFGHQRTMWEAWAEQGQGLLGEAPWDAPDRYVTNSPIFKAQKIQAPVLLIEGKEDDLEPQAEEMFSALYRLNKIAKLVRFEHEGHIEEKPENVRRAIDETFSWFDKYLKIKRDSGGKMVPNE
jgi:dipeptidyl aminopeptidase/acylaminoacyl peptidase